MTPIKTSESNFTYRGPAADISDLPCRLEGGQTFSVWQLTDAERAWIAKGANIRLGIYGMRPIPPVSLDVVPNDGPWALVSSPCKVCGKEPTDAAHYTGEGTHAFKCE